MWKLTDLPGGRARLIAAALILLAPALAHAAGDDERVRAELAQRWDVLVLSESTVLRPLESGAFEVLEIRPGRVLVDGEAADRDTLRGLLGEDDAATPGAIELPADCADVPYFLRAYFAWKLRLPFQWSRCEAESAWRAPVCRERFENTAARTERGELANFQAFR